MCSDVVGIYFIYLFIFGNINCHFLSIFTRECVRQVLVEYHWKKVEFDGFTSCKALTAGFARMRWHTALTAASITEKKVEFNDFTSCKALTAGFARTRRHTTLTAVSITEKKVEFDGFTSCKALTAGFARTRRRTALVACFAGGQRTALI